MGIGVKREVGYALDPRIMNHSGHADVISYETSALSYKPVKRAFNYCL